MGTKFYAIIIIKWLLKSIKTGVKELKNKVFGKSRNMRRTINKFNAFYIQTPFTV